MSEQSWLWLASVGWHMFLVAVLSLWLAVVQKRDWGTGTWYEGNERSKMYIVGSGDGYFVRFDGDSPLMDSDPICATRMKKKQAEKVVGQLGELGFVGELIVEDGD